MSEPNYLPAAYTPAVPAVSQTNETSAALLGARAEAEIKARTFVALSRPRSMEQFREKMLTSCERFRFADAAMYDKPVGGGKTASGLSIRFAEEAARLFGNLDISVTVISEDDERRVIEAVGVDLENNLVHRAQAVVPKYVERLQPRQGDEIIGQRKNSRGIMTYKIRASDDAMFTEHQKNAAKAVREVVLKHIPAEIKEECEERIEQTMKELGDKDPDKFRDQVLSGFYRLGVTREQVEEYLGKSVSQMNVAELHMLRRVAQGIKQGEGTWAEAMDAKRAERAPAPAAAPSTGGLKGATSKLNDALRSTAAAPAPAAAAAAPEAPAPPPAPTPTAEELAAEIAAQDAETARLDQQAEKGTTKRR